MTIHNKWCDVLHKLPPSHWLPAQKQDLIWQGKTRSAAGDEKQLVAFKLPLPYQVGLRRKRTASALINDCGMAVTIVMIGQTEARKQQRGRASSEGFGILGTRGKIVAVTVERRRTAGFQHFSVTCRASLL
jgi:hypothetical protein